MSGLSSTNSVATTDPPRARYFPLRQRPFSYTALALSIAAAATMLIYRTTQEVRLVPPPSWTSPYAIAGAAIVIALSLHRVRRAGLIPDVAMRWKVLDAALWTVMLWSVLQLVKSIALLIAVLVMFKPNLSQMYTYSTDEQRWSAAFWLGSPPVFLVAAWYGRRWTKRAVRRHSQQCADCGYSLEGNLSGVCPECGKQVEPVA